MTSNDSITTVPLSVSSNGSMPFKPKTVHQERTKEVAFSILKRIDALQTFNETMYLIIQLMLSVSSNGSMPFKLDMQAIVATLEDELSVSSNRSMPFKLSPFKLALQKSRLSVSSNGSMPFKLDYKFWALAHWTLSVSSNGSMPFKPTRRNYRLEWSVAFSILKRIDALQTFEDRTVMPLVLSFQYPQTDRCPSNRGTFSIACGAD